MRATALDANRIQLNWQDNANNETGFVLNDGGALAVQIGANVTTYLVTGLTPNSYHCYYVYAFNDYGHSASTGWACATTTNVSNPPTATPTPSPTPTFTPTPTATRTPQPPTFTPTFTPTATPGQAPAAPSNLQARALDANHIQLTWSDNANNETGFAVYDGDIQVATVNANITTYTVSGLAPGSYHCYHLYAFNSFGNSAWTDWACTSTLAPTSTPTNTPTTVLCPRKSEGDADCNGRIDLVDYEIWRQEYYGTLTTKTADFNGDGVVDMTDFAIWQAHYPS